jgi:hypothetical protein
MSTSRRRFLKVLGAGVAGAFTAAPIARALASGSSSKDFFILIHQAGGWDVTLWSDPRNSRQGDYIGDPATTDDVDTSKITGWKDQDLDGDNTQQTFQLLQRGNYVLGPAMGSLADMYDRFTLINGISMNTVSHPDGTYFSSTGRHLAGGRPVAASIDTMLANEMVTSDNVLPSVSVNFPSTFIGDSLDSSVSPLRVSDITAVAKSLARSALYDTDADRAAVTELLKREGADLATDAYYPQVPGAFELQVSRMPELLSDDIRGLFDKTKLQAAHPAFFTTPPQQFQKNSVINAAFAIEAIRKQVTRCVSFQMSSCDTHNTNYKFHPLILQETFEMIATLIKEMDQTTFVGSSDKLSDHVHVLVISEFCRTPQINLSGGRDHYPNNSALIISPKFKANTVFGASDGPQLLPVDQAGVFTDGARPPTPADVLATFMGGFGVDPRKYMRDGEVIEELLQ